MSGPAATRPAVSADKPIPAPTATPPQLAKPIKSPHAPHTQAQHANIQDTKITKQPQQQSLQRNPKQLSGGPTVNLPPTTQPTKPTTKLTTKPTKATTKPADQSTKQRTKSKIILRSHPTKPFIPNRQPTKPPSLQHSQPTKLQHHTNLLSSKPRKKNRPTASLPPTKASPFPPLRAAHPFPASPAPTPALSAESRPTPRPAYRPTSQSDSRPAPTSSPRSQFRAPSTLLYGFMPLTSPAPPRPARPGSSYRPRPASQQHRPNKIYKKRPKQQKSRHPLLATLSRLLAPLTDTVNNLLRG